MSDSFNRIHNSSNPAQGREKRVLALCSAGLLRSPTAAWVLSNAPYNYNTRAAGIDPEYALVPVDEVLINWADEIICVHPSIEKALQYRAGKEDWDLTGKIVVVLNIPDHYCRRDSRLVAHIEKQYQEWINGLPEVPTES